MKTKLKTLALALVASLTFAACAEEPACAPKTDAPAAEPAAAVTAEPAATETQVRPRRTRRTKKDKAAAPEEGKQKTPRRRRTRKAKVAELPVTGMLDSAE